MLRKPDRITNTASRSEETNAIKKKKKRVKKIQSQQLKKELLVLLNRKIKITQNKIKTRKL